tara:strand:+ start:537 stop:749 length:213 start_codon:yes stop_codon:yes gene_type:complete
MMPHKESLEHVKDILEEMRIAVAIFEKEIAIEIVDMNDDQELEEEIENAKDLLQSCIESIGQIILLGGGQ